MTSSQMNLSDPRISQVFPSRLLSQSDGPAGSDSINTADQEVYGPASCPIRFRIGNGGAGYTGILRLLSERYISQTGNDFRIGWVSNHSRHSQIALLAGVVDVALTYEPENEELSIQEGWARRVGKVFNDHFMLVGPDVRLSGGGFDEVLREIARRSEEGERSVENGEHKAVFHTRGDGSATFAKEQTLWKAAGVDVSQVNWIKTHPLTPYEALVKAEGEGAFLLTDRATFLTAKRDNVIPSLQVHVEGGEDLLNPCSALVRTSALGDLNEETRLAALNFAEWLVGDEAQNIVRYYGIDRPLPKPLFTVACEDEFCDEDRLAG